MTAIFYGRKSPLHLMNCINDVTSPKVLISFICELSLMIVSITAYVIWMKRMKNKEEAKKSPNDEQIDR